MSVGNFKVVCEVLSLKETTPGKYGYKIFVVGLRYNNEQDTALMTESNILSCNPLSPRIKEEK